MCEFRQTVRSVVQRPAFALTAILTIALGIGANTAVYAVIHAVLLEPLPFRNPSARVQVWETYPELHNLQVAVPDYLDWKNSVKSLDLAAYTFEAIDKATLTGQGDPVPVPATSASEELFPLLGIKPLLGRLYGPEEERAKQNVALISESLWRRKFSADPKVVGRLLRLGETSFMIAGVLPQRNAFPSWADVWMPFSLIDPALYTSRKYHPLEVIGHVRSRASLRRAEAEMEKTARQLSAAYPATNGKIGAFAVPLMEMAVGDVRPALFATWIAVGLVLLIACTNLAHLMMGRTLHRRQEVSIRLALGASYSVSRRQREFGIRSAIGARQQDLLAQVLRECLIVVIPGLLVGLAIAAACSRFMRVLLYRVSPTDPFSSLLAIVSVLVLCLGCVAIPAVRAAKVDPVTILREQ